MSTPEVEEAASSIPKKTESQSIPSKKPSPLILPATGSTPLSLTDHSPTGSSPNSPLRRSTAFYGKGKEKRRQSFLETTLTSPQSSSSPDQEHTQASLRSPEKLTPTARDNRPHTEVEYVEVLSEISHPSRVPGFSNSLVDYFEIDPLLLKKKQPQNRLTTNKKKRTFSGTTIKNYPRVRSFSGGNMPNVDSTEVGQMKQSTQSFLDSLEPSQRLGGSDTPRLNRLSTLMETAQVGRATGTSNISLQVANENVHQKHLSARKSKGRASVNNDVLRALERESGPFGRSRSTQIMFNEDDIPPFTPTFGPVRKSYNSDVNDRASSYRISRTSNRSSLPRHPFRDTFGFDKQLLNSVGKVSPLRRSVHKDDPPLVDSEFISYPQRVSSLQNLHKELNKERLSLLGEIDELKRISKHLDDACNDDFVQKIQQAENRIETFEHLIKQAQESISHSPNSSPEVVKVRGAGGKEVHEYHRTADTENQSSGSSALSDESINVDMYIPYTIPENKISLPNYAYSRIQPLLLDDTPVFKSSLYKLGSNRQWQKREFRIDGFMLVCLEKKKIKVEPKTVILAKYSTANGLQSDPELRKHFYPTSPPLPHISHPLVATASSINNNLGADQYVEYFQPPKWVIPLSDILAVTLLARNGFKVRKCFAIHTAERKYILRAQTEMETACWVYLLKRMAINRYHEINLLEYSPQSPSTHIDSLIHINPTNSKNTPSYETKADREVVLDQWRSTVNELVQREPNLQRSPHAKTTLSLSPPNHRRLRNNPNSPSPTSRNVQLSRDRSSSAAGSIQRRKPLPTPPARVNSSPIINPLRSINQSEA